MPSRIGLCTLRRNDPSSRLPSPIWICLPRVHTIQIANSLPWRYLRQHFRRSRWRKLVHCMSFRFRLPRWHRHICNWLSLFKMRARLLLPLRDQLHKIIPLPRWYLQCFANSHSVKRLLTMYCGKLLSSRLKQRETMPGRILLFGWRYYTHTLS